VGPQQHDRRDHGREKEQAQRHAGDLEGDREQNRSKGPQQPDAQGETYQHHDQRADGHEQQVADPLQH
jgi:hypothetical protein